MATQAQQRPAQQAAQATNGKPADPSAPAGFDGAKWLNAELDKIIEYKPFKQEETIKLSARLVLRFLVKPTKSGKVCTEEQAMRFMMLCKARQLNPWEGDAFIVGYDSKDGPEFNLITSHQAFLKRAEAHDQYDGMESGVVCIRDKQLVEYEGDYVVPGDELVGAWCRVHRRDRRIPTYRRLNLATFNKSFGRWNVDRAGMIVKCAESDGMRSAFPNNIGGMHLEASLDSEQEPAEPKARRGVDFRGALMAPVRIPASAAVHHELPQQQDEESEVAPLAEGELSPLEAHLIQFDEAENDEQIDAIYLAAYSDPAMSKSDKVKIGSARDDRKAALKAAASFGSEDPRDKIR